MISVIVPLYNEAPNISPLCAELIPALRSLGEDFELCLVDDGSRDQTWGEIHKNASLYPEVIAVRHAKNYGQTAALQSGILHTTGDPIITIDGDLENDPADIPELLRRHQEGFDIVSGWRKNRWSDQTLSRKIPSHCANFLISYLSGVHLHDYGCTLKVYRRAILEQVPLYGDMHRLLPAYAGWAGASISEIVVNYRKRRFGVSKYGFSRTFRVVLDLVFLKFFLTYMNRPIHFFGGIGLGALIVSVLSAVSAIGLKLAGLRTFVATPLPVISALFCIVGVQLIVMGVLAEILMRIYHMVSDRLPYRVTEKIHHRQ